MEVCEIFHVTSIAMQHEQLIDEFKTITNSDDREKIENLLTIHDWNLNNAIMTFFDTGFTTIEHQALPAVHDGSESLSYHHHSIDHHDDHDLRQGDESSFATASGADPFSYSTAQSFELHDLIPKLPFAPKISNNWQFQIGIYNSLHTDLNHHVTTKPVIHNNNNKVINAIWFLILFIPNKLLTLFYSILKYFLKPKPNSFPREINYALMDLNYDAKVDHFNIFNKDFNDVYQSTKDNYHWLLVILINNDTQFFVDNLFKNDQFSKIFHQQVGTIADKNNIFVGNVDKSPEAWEIGTKYNSKRLPSIFLISNVTNNPSIMSSMSILYKSNISSSFLTSDTLHPTINKITKNLKRFIDHYEPQLVNARFEKKEIEMSRMLKQHQDEAYIKSLETDKLKKMEKQKQLDLQNYQQLKVEYLKYLNDVNWWHDVNKHGNIRIQLKLPDEKFVVNLAPTLQLKDLYLYIEMRLLLHQQQTSTEESSIDESVSSSPSLDVQSFKHDYRFNFELLQPYPKKVFDELDANIDDILKSGMSLLVELNEPDDDNDDDEIS